MQQRQLDIQRSALVLAQETSTQRAIKQNDARILAEKLALLKNNFNKVDYAVLLDRNNNVLARSDVNVLFNPAGILGELNKEIVETGVPLSSTETVPLRELFTPEAKKINSLRSSSGRASAAKDSICSGRCVKLH